MRRKKGKIILLSVLAVVLVMILSCGIYLNVYYHADEDALAVIEMQDDIKISRLENDALVFEPEDAKAGFIFYPGGKVQQEAYAPLMKACAGQGILCVLVQMPFNLAVFDINAADGILAQYPQIEKWYIGGHSLGGSMAAAYLEKHTEAYEGLILLASYSAADLSDTDLDVLSVYGTNDGVLNMEKYMDNMEKLPRLMESEIEGGCHAYFGNYGQQAGDGAATISREEQIGRTAQTIAAFVE